MPELPNELRLLRAVRSRRLARRHWRADTGGADTGAADTGGTGTASPPIESGAAGRDAGNLA